MACARALLPAGLWKRGRASGKSCRQVEPACGSRERRQLPVHKQRASQERKRMMHWGESIRLALDALGVDKVKAFLTMLGVMIGSASIVLVVTIASTGKAYVVGQIEGIGANLAYAQLDRNGVPVVPGDELSPADLVAIRQSLSMVTA